MLHLRKGRTEIVKFESLYNFADMDELIEKLFGKANTKSVQDFARKNAFAMAISGAKLRLGNGFIIEKC